MNGVQDWIAQMEIVFQGIIKNEASQASSGRFMVGEATRKKKIQIHINNGFLNAKADQSMCKYPTYALYSPFMELHVYSGRCGDRAMLSAWYAPSILGWRLVKSMSSVFGRSSDRDSGDKMEIL